MPRTTRALASRASPKHPQMLMQMLRGGNGHGHSAPMSERQTDQLARMEMMLCDLQQQFAVQFQRIADLQLQLDRSIAARPIPPPRQSE